MSDPENSFGPHIRFNQAEIRKQQRKDDIGTAIFCLLALVMFGLSVYGVLSLEARYIVPEQQIDLTVN